MAEVQILKLNGAALELEVFGLGGLFDQRLLLEHVEEVFDVHAWLVDFPNKRAHVK